MIYEPVEICAAVMAAQFEAKMTALIAAKGVAGGVDPSVTVYKRRSAEIYAPLEATTLPGLGIYCTSVRTQMKRQGSRDSTPTIVFDYFARGTDAEVLARQCELAAEAIIAVLDLIPVSGNDGLWEAGAIEGSVTVAIQGSSHIEGQDNYEDRVIVTCPVEFRDVGL